MIARIRTFISKLNMIPIEPTDWACCTLSFSIAHAMLNIYLQRQPIREATKEESVEKRVEEAEEEAVEERRRQLWRK